MSPQMISLADLEAAERRLDELPNVMPKERTQISPPEAVRRLKPKLRLLQKKGYTTQQIHEQLTSMGLAVTINAVRTVLRKHSRKRAPELAAEGATPGVPQKAAASTTASSDAAKSASDVHPQAGQKAAGARR